MACQIKNNDITYSRVHQVVTEFKIPLKAGPVKWMKNQSVIGKKYIKAKRGSPLHQGTTLSCPSVRNWTNKSVKFK